MIPKAIARAFLGPAFEAEQFTATKWESGADKAKFANHLARFIAEGFPQHLFTERLCNRLASTFGHIAHYSTHCYWDYHFVDERTKADFSQAHRGARAVR
jgi:hypothetical protein